MALVRILIDGYSLLHAWPGLARGKERHSEEARDALIYRLTLYRDAVGTPMTIFFDGQQTRSGTRKAHDPSEVEILYSRKGQTADQMIERAAHRFLEYGETLVVTDDTAERDVVVGFGGMAQSCLEFISSVEATLAAVSMNVQNHNRKERQRYRSSTRRIR